MRDSALRTILDKPSVRSVWIGIETCCSEHRGAGGSSDDCYGNGVSSEAFGNSPGKGGPGTFTEAFVIEKEFRIETVGFHAQKLRIGRKFHRSGLKQFADVLFESDSVFSVFRELVSGSCKVPRKKCRRQIGIIRNIRDQFKDMFSGREIERFCFPAEFPESLRERTALFFRGDGSSIHAELCPP